MALNKPTHKSRDLHCQSGVIEVKAVGPDSPRYGMMEIQVMNPSLPNNTGGEFGVAYLTAGQFYQLLDNLRLTAEECASIRRQMSREEAQNPEYGRW